MSMLLLGCAVLIAILLTGKLFLAANPAHIARFGRTAGGVAMLAAAAFLGARGMIVLAGPLGLAGLGLLGFDFGFRFRPAGFWSRTQRTKGQTSRVRSAFLEMELDHDSGTMRGRILAGPHAGSELDTLSVAALAALLPDLDEESRVLLIAYLDRREPRWSDQARSDGAAGPAAPPRGARMSAEEAYQILGLEPGASAEEIGRAHRTLMKKLHPDQGGSTYLAARVNEAKDTLLRRHQ